MRRTFMLWGAVLAMLAVAIGAFGAHLLEPVIGTDRMAVYETGVQYHMMHALGLMAIALAAGSHGDSRRLLWSGRLLAAGTLLFSGSLYVLAVTDISVLGAITPLGGVCFIAGWLCLVFEAASWKGKDGR